MTYTIRCAIKKYYICFEIGLVFGKHQASCGSKKGGDEVGLKAKGLKFRELTRYLAGLFRPLTLMLCMLFLHTVDAYNTYRY